MQFLPPEWHESLPSTNTHLKERVLLDPGLPTGFVAAARRQTAGRGRYMRTWLTSAHRDLTFSFLMREKVDIAWVPLLPMAVSLGVHDYLQSLGIAPQVKWPNDVLVSGRKICGILSEYVPDAGPPHTVVVGAGLNLGLTEQDATQIGRPATSVAMELGNTPEPETALEVLLDFIAPWIERWRASGYAGLREAWEARAVGVGRKVTVGEGNNRKEGVLEGFGVQGELLLRAADGRLETITMGDVMLQDS